MRVILMMRWFTFEDYKKVNRWALDSHLSYISCSSPDPCKHISFFEYNGHTFYLDNYHAYAVLTKYALVKVDPLEDRLKEMFIGYINGATVPCTDTNISRLDPQLNNKRVLRMLKDQHGNDIAIIDDFFKYLPKVYYMKYNLEKKCVVVFDSMNIPIALFMETKIRQPNQNTERGE